MIPQLIILLLPVIILPVQSTSQPTNMIQTPPFQAALSITAPSTYSDIRNVKITALSPGSGSGTNALSEENFVYVTESGHAEFTSRVPLHTFTGESEHLVGMIDFQESMIDFYLDLNTLETGIGRRDRDMFRTLDVDNYPFAEFTGTLETPFDEETSGRQFVEASGEFTVHGVTRSVSIEGHMEWQGDHLRLEAEWVLLLDDYNIEPPGILFYRVSDEQEIRIEAVLEPRQGDEYLNEN